MGYNLSKPAGFHQRAGGWEGDTGVGVQGRERSPQPGPQGRGRSLIVGQQGAAVDRPVCEMQNWHLDSNGSITPAPASARGFLQAESLNSHGRKSVRRTGGSGTQTVRRGSSWWLEKLRRVVMIELLPKMRSLVFQLASNS